MKYGVIWQFWPKFIPQLKQNLEVRNERKKKGGEKSGFVCYLWPMGLVASNLRSVDPVGERNDRGAWECGRKIQRCGH